MMEAPRWASFGRDGSNSRHNALEDTLTVQSVGGLRLVWEAKGGECTSTPAVVDEVVYYGDWNGWLYARDAADGAERWKTRITGKTADGPHFAIASSPAVVEDRVFVGDMDGLFHAVDRESGSVLWSVELDDHPAVGLHGSPTVIGDLVVVGVASGELAEIKEDYTFRGSIVGLDAASGRERWRVYVSEDDETSGAGVSVWSSPAVDEARKRIYIGTGNTYEEPASPRSDAIVSIDYETGELAWVRQFTEGDVYTLLMSEPQGPDADIGAAPNLFSIDDIDVVGAGDKAGAYAVLERDTGEVVWMTQLTEGSHLGGVMVAAAYDGERIYVASNRWPAGFDTETVFIPNFDDPDNTSAVFALDARNGRIVWQVEMPHPTLGGMAVAGGVLYTGTSDGTVRALATDDGRTLWSDVAGSALGSGQSVVGGRLFVSHGFRFIGIKPGVAGEEGGLRVYGLG